MSEKSPRSGTQILAKVSEVAFETDRLPSEAEADQILRAENIDVTDLQSWISDRLVGVRARQKLRKAPERRFALIEELAKMRARVSSGTSDIRQRVMEKLQVIASSSPDAAGVYFRKFKDAPDSDLPDLEAELNLLEEWSDDQADQKE